MAYVKNGFLVCKNEDGDETTISVSCILRIINDDDTCRLVTVYSLFGTVSPYNQYVIREPYEEIKRLLLSEDEK